LACLQVASSASCRRSDPQPQDPTSNIGAPNFPYLRPVAGMAPCARLGDETAAFCRASSQRRSRGPQSGASAGWWVDRPSATPGARNAAKSSSETPPGWWKGPSKRQAAVGATEQGVLCAPRDYRSEATGREPGRPAPPPSPRGRGPARVVVLCLAQARVAAEMVGGRKRCKALA
jgi:hypothetical protein